MRRPMLRRAVRFALLALAACKIPDMGSGSTGSTDISRVVVAPASATINVGGTQQFTATAYDNNGNVVSGAAVTWDIGGPQASIDANGLATGVQSGGPITVGANVGPNHIRGEAALTISQVSTVGSVTVTPSAATIGIGQPVQLTAVVRDMNGVVITSQAVTWSSADATKASVSASGLVTGVALGASIAITASAGTAHGSSAVTVQANAVSTELFAISMCGSTGFAVGAGGRIMYYDGTSWQVRQSGTTLDLYSVISDCSQQSLTAFAVGAGGSILRFDGANWNPVASGATKTLLGIDRNSPPAWVVGAGGTILYNGGSGWTSSASGSASDLYWTTSAQGIAGVTAIAIGAGGTILVNNGTAWSPMTSGTTALLRGAVALNSGATVFAVGSGGTIRRSSVSNLNSWSAVTSGTTNDLLAMYAPQTGAEAFAVGAGGTILHYNGTLWAAQLSPTSVRLNGVDGSSGTSVWAVGAGGAILHYDGTSWTSANGPPPTPVATITIAPTSASVGAGQTVQLSATTKDASGTTLYGRTVVWTSSNSSVASVDPVNGLVTGIIAGGPVTITATSEGKSSTAQVTVTSPVASVTIAPPTAAVGVGLTTALVATAFDASNNVLTGRVFTWSSANTAIATVSASGVVTGVGAGGPVTITATSEGVNGTAQVTVYLPVATVTVTPATGTVGVGQYLPLTATAKDAAGNVLTGKSFSWTTSNSAIAVVDAAGGVSGVSTGGPVTISATAEGKSGSASITVAPAVATVTVSPATAAVGEGGTVQLTATPKDGSGNVLTGRSVAWSTSSDARATVSATGLVTGVVAGAPATITATVEGKKGVASITVSLAVASVVVTPPSSTVPMAGRVQLSAAAYDVNGILLAGHAVSWASSNATIATVDANGVVTGVANGGPVTITAASEGQIGTASVTVAMPSPVATVVVTPPAAMLGAGETIVLTAVTLDGTGTVVSGRAVSWGTSNNAAATVVANGPATALVTGIGNGGSATITATSEGKSGTSAITTALVTFASVTEGVSFTCALTAGGAAYCWGDNSGGELGIGSADTLPHPSPAPVSGGLAFTVIAAGGGAHVCGLVAGGAMYCWGGNSFGQLGIGTVDATPHPAPVAVMGGHSFIALTTNGPYTCGIDTSGAAWCWGDNSYGELGVAALSQLTPTPTPTLVDGGHVFSTIAGGTYHLCAATAVGAGWCWGRNERGELGVGAEDVANHASPEAVVGGVAFAALTGGANYTCGIASNAAGWCWGANGSGGLGTGLPGRVSVPTAIVGGYSWKTLSAARQTCGVTTSNVGYCWGDNSAGDMGIGAADVNAHLSPEAITGGLSFVSISANRALNSCGVTTTGLVYCWGYNSRGDGGNGTIVENDAPVRVLAQP